MATSVSVLLLNADYQPLRVIRWRDAIELIFDGKAELVEEYAGRVLHSAREAYAYPAVVRLLKYVSFHKRVRFNRANVLARDSYTCGYCGVKPKSSSGKPDIEELSIDHVVPRAQSVNGFVRLPWPGERCSVTTWRNVITECRECNSLKRDRTPDEAKMKLCKPPRVPTPIDVLRMSLTRVKIPEEWKLFLPEGSAWRGYWDDELEA